ncbi:hypothetical protein [Endozoicomonas sp. YOMI1]|uniref:hypothetical protein n=1 Tax=Endozoicomonas sp. YOMI1 TaxID=2828739 RepID=UPI00214939E8|nr:hypothetical protein [Endozoicomonas sp. YOMI1]
MANTGPAPAVVPQVTTTHIPAVPPPPPGVKPPPTVVNAQPVASSPTTQVNQSTQVPRRQAPRLHLSERVKQGITALGGLPPKVAEKGVQATPAQNAPAETTPAVKTAEEGTAAKKSEKTSEKTSEKASKKTSKKTSEKKSETKEQPITVIHKLSLSERVIEKLKVVGSYCVAPLKLIVSAVKFVAKPLQDYVITPAYEGFLFVFQPAKYDARKLEQKAAAEKAVHDQKQANRQAFEKACLAEAMKRHNKLNSDISVVHLARHYGFTEQEVEDEVKSQKARAEANFLFNKQLEADNLELKKEKELRTNPETSEQYYVTPTRALKVADETNRATVTITEKTPGGKTVEKILDADNAEVAMRLGNDPAFATALNNYNKELKAYGQLLAEFKKEDAKYQQAKEKAAKKNKAFDKQAPVHPGEPPSRPVLKCTDENVIAAFKLVREPYRTNLQTTAQTLTKEVEALKAAFVAAYPNNQDTRLYISGAINPEAYKAEVQAWVNTLESMLGESRKTLKEAEEGGFQSMIPSLNRQISNQQCRIDINKRHLAIYAKECQLMSVHEEIEYLNRMCPNLKEHRDQDIDDWKNGARLLDPKDPDYDKRVSGIRDRLEIERLKEWVYKDEKGNVLDIFTRDANGIKTGIDRAKYALVNDVIIPTPDRKLTPAHNGKTSAPDYQHQKGMKWSKMSPAQRPYQGYVAQRDENGKVLKDSDGNVKWKEAPGQLSNHWVVKHSDVNGLHEGYDKFTTIVKNRTPVSKPEVPVVIEPEASVRVPEVPVSMTHNIEKQTQEPVAMKARATTGEKRYALTKENVRAHNEYYQQAENSSKPRVRSTDGDLIKFTDDSVADDSPDAMPKDLFRPLELDPKREEEIRQLRLFSEQLQQRMPTAEPARHDAATSVYDETDLLEEIFRGSPTEMNKFVSDSKFVAAKRAERDSRPVIDCESHSDDSSEATVEEPLIEQTTLPPVQAFLSNMEDLNRLEHLFDEIEVRAQQVHT